MPGGPCSNPRDDVILVGLQHHDQGSNELRGAIDDRGLFHKWLIRRVPQAATKARSLSHAGSPSQGFLRTSEALDSNEIMTVILPRGRATARRA